MERAQAAHRPRARTAAAVAALLASSCAWAPFPVAAAHIPPASSSGHMEAAAPRPLARRASVNVTSSTIAGQYKTRGADHIPGTMVHSDPWAASFPQIGRTAHRSLQVTEAVFEGFLHPLFVSWDSNGHVLVTEKAGLVTIYDDWNGNNRRNLLDITAKTASYGDHGLSSALYYRDHLYITYMQLNPEFGNVCNDYGQFDGGRTNADVKGCRVTAVFARYPYDPVTGTITGPEEVIVDGNADDLICAQFTAHGITNVVVGPDGFLYVAAGDGAAFTAPDSGQLGDNPCNDHAGYGGAFRVQDPEKYNGKILRVDPTTLDISIFATGFRNPWRLTVSNGKLYETETGWYTWEEVNEIQEGKNYGWPCYEGPEQQADYFFVDSPVCNNLQTSDEWMRPIFAYKSPPNAVGAVQSISALLVKDGRILYGDYTQRVIASVSEATGGDKQILALAVSPIAFFDTPIGLLFVDYDTGSVRRIPAPGAELASPSASPRPLTHISSSSSTWDPATAGQMIYFTASSNMEGREGLHWDWWSVLLFDCVNSGDCKAMHLANSTRDSSFGFPAPDRSGTIQVFLTSSTYAGASATDTVYLRPIDGTECQCPGTRTFVDGHVDRRPPSALRPTAAASGATSLTKSVGFIAGVSAAAAVVALLMLSLLAMLWRRRRGHHTGDAKPAPAPAAPLAVVDST